MIEDQPCVCARCKTKFPNYEHYQKHECIPAPTPDFTCAHCGHAMNSLADMVNHDGTDCIFAGSPVPMDEAKTDA